MELILIGKCLTTTPFHPPTKGLYHLTTTCSDWKHALEWAVGISRCEFKGTSWSTFRQSCDLAQGSALESPSGIKPSPSLPKSWLLPLPNLLALGTSARKKLLPLALSPVDLSLHPFSSKKEAHSPGASPTSQEGNLKLHPRPAPFEITLDVWNYLILGSEKGCVFYYMTSQLPAAMRRLRSTTAVTSSPPWLGQLPEGRDVSFLFKAAFRAMLGTQQGFSAYLLNE